VGFAGFDPSFAAKPALFQDDALRRGEFAPRGAFNPRDRASSPESGEIGKPA
jgi:hypothetical protein